MIFISTVQLSVFPVPLGVVDATSSFFNHIEPGQQLGNNTSPSRSKCVKNTSTKRLTLSIRKGPQNSAFLEEEWGMLIGGTCCHEITFWELRLEGGSGGVTCDFQWEQGLVCQLATRWSSYLLKGTQFKICPKLPPKCNFNCYLHQGFH